MAGIRIQHHTQRNAVLTIVDQQRPYLAPLTCGVCFRVHTFKTYHINVDETGAAIVSAEIVERLRRLPQMAGFTVANEVKKPPAQRVGLGGAGPLIRPTITPHPTLKEPH